jgi:hypothetical protein
MPILYPETIFLSPQEAAAYAVRHLHPHGLATRPRCVWPVRRQCPILAYDLDQALSYLLAGALRRHRTVADCRRAGSYYALRLPCDPDEDCRRIVPVALCVGHARRLSRCTQDYSSALLASSR